MTRTDQVYLSCKECSRDCHASRAPGLLTNEGIARREQGVSECSKRVFERDVVWLDIVADVPRCNPHGCGSSALT